MIVDSLGFTDADLNSVIGRKDGQVYENLMKWAMDQPINQYQVSFDKCAFPIPINDVI
jgi:hypothetical protein